jgi:hypothetical protein
LIPVRVERSPKASDEEEGRTRCPALRVAL